ncbi:hypothetical protein ACIPL1_07675 [Pseudomonas sp. NPDC090202]|uniref:hypothetical protein n=1 Tax=Pseudomonas sp. NPDC090202 TaxID=3364476 RepID=UPI00380BEC6E
MGLQAYDEEWPFYHVMATGMAHAIYTIVTRQGGRWASQQISFAYDWNAEAVRAQANGGQDWLTPLITGQLACLQKLIPDDRFY